MSTSPKIVVLKTREILYTLILLFLAILLIVCLILMFAPKKDASETATLPSGHAGSESSRTAAYVPGIYTAPVTLGEDTMNVEVTVGTNEIQSIRLVNLSEATAASYPLVSPSLEEIAAQILEKQSLDDITCPAENRYTAQLLLLAISDALATAAV